MKLEAEFMELEYCEASARVGSATEDAESMEFTELAEFAEAPRKNGT